MTTEQSAGRGGTRRNSGRKTEPAVEGPVKKRTVTLDELTMRKAAVLGGGEVSRGLRAAVRHTYDAYQADKFVPTKQAAKKGGAK